MGQQVHLTFDYIPSQTHIFDYIPSQTHILPIFCLKPPLLCLLPVQNLPPTHRCNHQMHNEVVDTVTAMKYARRVRVGLMKYQNEV